jgi:hypothetical protein
VDFYGSPIKGDVKRHFSPPAGGRGCFGASSPQPQATLCDVDRRRLLAPAARLRIPIPRRFMLVIVTTPFVT